MTHLELGSDRHVLHGRDIIVSSKVGSHHAPDMKRAPVPPADAKKMLAQLAERNKAKREIDEVHDELRRLYDIDARHKEMKARKMELIPRLEAKEEQAFQAFKKARAPSSGISEQEKERLRVAMIDARRDAGVARVHMQEMGDDEELVDAVKRIPSLIHRLRELKEAFSERFRIVYREKKR